MDTLKQKAGAIRKAPETAWVIPKQGFTAARPVKSRKRSITPATQSKHALKSLKKRKSQGIRTRCILIFSLTDPPANKTVIRAEGFSCVRGGRVLLENAGFALPNASKTALCGGKRMRENYAAQSDKRRPCEYPYCPESKDRIIFIRPLKTLIYQKPCWKTHCMKACRMKITVRTILARLLFKREDVFKRTEVFKRRRAHPAFLCQTLCVGLQCPFCLTSRQIISTRPSVEVLEGLLRDYEGTVLFVSHDRAFVNAVADRLILFKYKKLITFDGNLDGYDEEPEKGSVGPPAGNASPDASG